MSGRSKTILESAILITFLLLVIFVGKWYWRVSKQAYPTYKPRIEMSYFKVKKFTKDSTDMDMILLVRNPLPFKLLLGNLSYNIYIGGVEVIESKYPASINIEAEDSSLLKFPVIMKNEKLTEILNKLKKQGVDSTEYKIEGNADLNFLLLKNTPYHFNFSKKLPLYIIPKLAVEKIRVKKIGLKHTQLLINCSIHNRNVFPYNFKETVYEIKINGSHLVDGKIDSTINIPAHSKVEITLPADVSLIKALEAGFDSWFKSATTEYDLYFAAKIVADDNAIKDSKVILEAKGKLKDLKQ